MSLELWHRGRPRLLDLSALDSDVDGSFELERFRDDLSPEVDAWFLREARRGLPPGPDA